MTLQMDEDGSGEVDFEEFKVWCAGMREKKGKFAAALNDRWSGALKRIQEKQREEKDLNEAQKALEAVAKSHGKLTSKVNQTGEQNKKLQRTIDALNDKIREQEADLAAQVCDVVVLLQNQT